MALQKYIKQYRGVLLGDIFPRCYENPSIDIILMPELFGIRRTRRQVKEAEAVVNKLETSLRELDNSTDKMMIPQFRYCLMHAEETGTPHKMYTMPGWRNLEKVEDVFVDFVGTVNVLKTKNYSKNEVLNHSRSLMYEQEKTYLGKWASTPQPGQGEGKDIKKFFRNHWQWLVGASIGFISMISGILRFFVMK
ncbi:MAG: hypothetical protein QMD05_00425 [Candidatus Brocadiaceae bacterium]|nr:hypothetical protein [Candidatus Brocadiaceae bacterium]